MFDDQAPAPRTGHAFCGIVPPYVLEQLASSGDPHLEAHARRTLAHDERLRAERRGQLSAASGDTTTGRERGRRQRATTDAVLRSIHDAKTLTRLPGTLVRTEGDPPTDDADVTRAYDGLGDTWALWHDVFGRNSLDDKGLGLVATVHYGKGYDNAFWDGQQMVFGDGDGEIFTSFTSSLDVIGHELAHGVTQYTSGLNYQDQSGALNEHISDVFGALVVQRSKNQSAAEADWLIGADLLAPGVKGRALRDMRNPGTAYDDPRLGRDPQPAHMRDFVDTSDDNGGVHINSGIPNRAFVLVADALGGPAWGDAGAIWVDTITGDIKADCDFATFAHLTLAAASERFGPDAVQTVAVRDAWAQVGVEPKAPARRSRRRKAEPPAAAPAPEGDPAAAVVQVRRTGGFAGHTRERTIALDALPDADTEAWNELLSGRTLQSMAAATPSHTWPDAFTYEVRSAAHDVCVVLPEPRLPDGVRRLFDRTLERDG